MSLIEEVRCLVRRLFSSRLCRATPVAPQFLGPCANVSNFLRLLAHLLHVADWEFHPLIVFEKIKMPVHEFPVEGGEWAGVFAHSLFVIEATARAEVTHLVDVIAA